MKLIKCATLDIHEAKVVEVESTFSRALPGFSIVGLANTSIQESRDRVKSALSSLRYKFPPQKITINLSPSDLKKEGSHFDLSFALSVALQKESVEFGDIFVFGELGLDGKIKDTNLIFPIILSLVKQKRIKRVLIPKESFEKISKIPSIEIAVSDSLEEAIEFFKNQDKKFEKPKDLEYEYIEIAGKKYYFSDDFELDFYDVKGQEIAKRASLIAASGMHNILFEGSPGCGKSMCAKRIRYILPPMSLDEILENARLSSINEKEIDFKPVRNFRSPHHTSSRPSIFGGGSSKAMMGEVALANNGVLFFDEFPHFQKSVLESLREPLEDYRVLISRVNSKVEYKTKFLFIAAQNPCPCGNLLSSVHECRCSEVEIQRYKNRLSEPLLDRIDLYVQMDEVSTKDRPSMSSKEMFEIVKRAFVKQKERGQKELNGKMDEKDIEKYCKLQDKEEDLLHSAAIKFGLSQRGINKILRTARTIADIEDSNDIKKSHLLEAISYRRR
ncbi:MAG: YifB family Mg chelatase-like AAA ATPase [Epsilonproteobacteria bacterium]|nr:YifB family Mg chelatase-like AAA ATPase [Campylobacterota bacterium]